MKKTACILFANLLMLGLCACAPTADTPDGHDSTTDSITDAAIETSAAETAAETADETAAGETVSNETDHDTASESQTESETAKMLYYVCNDTNDPVGTAFRAGYDSPTDAAKTLCDRLASQGYRIVSSEGEVVYTPHGYTEWQCDILRECKWVTDYVRENGFIYGDASVNPAISHRDKKVSCDRFVGWVMYRMGYTDQPRKQGVVVSAMAEWCEANGFERIDNEADLQAGDIVLVKWTTTASGWGYPAHTFIYAGEASPAGYTYRYDCGSNSRIQSVQPSTEPIVQFWRAYRAPALTEPTETT